MREIMFRGKRTDNGEWVYGYYAEFHNRPKVNKPNSCQIFVPDENAYFCGSSIGGLWHIVDPETVGQFTGVYDWNGTKIFEGDIVREASLERDYVVEFRDSCFCGAEIVKDAGCRCFAKLNMTFIVVGNIYEQEGESL